MNEFDAVPKKWGNSVGVVIPAEVLQSEHIQLDRKIKVLVIGNPEAKLKQLFGSHKFKKPTQELMKEIDEGYDEH